MRNSYTNFNIWNIKVLFHTRKLIGKHWIDLGETVEEKSTRDMVGYDLFRSCIKNAKWNSTRMAAIFTYHDGNRQNYGLLERKWVELLTHSKRFLKNWFNVTVFSGISSAMNEKLHSIPFQQAIVCQNPPLIVEIVVEVCFAFFIYV